MGNYEDRSFTPEAVRVDSFYTDTEKKIIKPELFDTFAFKIAKSFIGKNEKGVVTSTQLRRLFDEVKRFEQMLIVKKDCEWAELIPYVKMIKSKTAYAVARAAKNKSAEYKNLETFISSGIDQVKSEKDFHIFVSLFEAVYGFYYEFAPKDCK